MGELLGRGQGAEDSRKMTRLEPVLGRRDLQPASERSFRLDMNSVPWSSEAHKEHYQE